jgi:hypothetical protein
MKYILSLIISGALVVSGFGQTRNVLVGTNNAVVQPTNFWNADASNARTGLGLGTAATSSVSAFQPASTALSNLATGNGGALSNLQATNLVGIIPASNISTVTFTNIGGTLAISSGGTGATNAVNARQNLGSTIVGDAVFIATNAAAARTAIGALATDGNAINLTNFPTILLQTNGNGAGLTNLTAANITGTVALASNLGSPLSLTNGGTGATNAAIARTNLGLGWSALTNTDATNFRNAIGLGTTNSVTFETVNLGDLYLSESVIRWGTNDIIEPETRIFFGEWTFDSGAIQIGGATNRPLYQAQTRTNLGLPWSGLTNSNATTFQAALFGSNTNPVLVNTNGEVVSPTNFWAVAPISTTVQYQTNVTGTSTNAATNSRNLFLFSLSPSVSGITNTVTLPTNTATTFDGDRATIIHLAQTTNAVTAIRQLGAATNLITLNQLDEAVLLMYRSGAWILADNISYVEPIFFSGTNAAANAATSRTNLGLGATNLVRFGGGFTNNVGVGVGSTNTGLASDGVLSGRLGLIKDGNIIAVLSQDDPFFGLYYPLTFQGANASSNAATTRTNLGIPLAALTNTNNANFRDAIELGATNNVSFSNVTASGTLTATGTVTATTNLVVNGFVDFSTNHTNVAPATNNQIQKFLQIRIGTNAFFLPLYQ